MKKAIATISTNIGAMTIYYNGPGEELTAEQGETVETMEYTAKSMADAVETVYQMYSFWPGWNLEMIEEV